MSIPARRGAVLAIVAALLLANPLYVDLVVDEPRPRSPTGYTATAVDPTNASDQRTIVTLLGNGEILPVDELAGANEYSPYGPKYRAPGRAAALLRRAIENDTARTATDSAAFTLGRVAANYRYVAVGDRDSTRFYRLSVEATERETIVSAAEVNRSTVATFLVYRHARLYGALPGYQRDTVDRVIESGEDGYRPYNDEFHEVTDDLVVKDDTYYLFSASVHVDDFGPTAQTVVTLVLYLLGSASLAAAVFLTARSYRSRDGES